MGHREQRSKRKKSEILKEADTIEENLQQNFALDFKIKKQWHMNETHSQFYLKLKDDCTNMVFVDGKAGSAKTFYAALVGLELLKEKKIKQIVYIRSVVESASRSIGALPGEIDEKFLPYAMPLIEKVKEITDDGSTAMLMNSGLIHTIPVNFVRGLTFHDSFVIVDEVQNFETHEIVSVLTRFGRNTKYCVCGDSKQADIRDKSCWPKIMNTFKDTESEEHNIFTFQFGESEIVRSKILKFITTKLGV